MGFFFMAFLWLGFTILGELLRPRPKFGAASPSALGDFQLPTAQQGRAIPAVFGTVKVVGPNVVWYGDLAAVAQKKKVKTGLFSSESVITGYKYFLGEQLALCHGPVDAVLRQAFDDRPVDAHTNRVARPSGTVGTGTWRGQDGGTNLHQYIDEDVANDQDRISQGFGGGGSICTVNLSTIGVPVAGARHTLYFRVRKVLPSGDVAFGYNLQDGANTPKAETGIVVGTAWTNIVRILTDAEVAQFLGYNNLRLLLFGGGSGNAYLECSWARLVVSETLNQAPDAWDANGHLQLVVEAETLFGGDDREGGIAGVYDFYRGADNQVPNDYLERVLGIDLPGYQGLCYAVARHVYVGTTNYLKPISFVVRRCPNQLGVGGGAENLSGDANPACVIYEVLTDEEWGLGVPAGKIDVASFLQVAGVLADEGLGLSMTWDQQAPASDFMADILRHVDGVMYTDPSTGQIKLRLARADYTPASLLRLSDESGVRSWKVSTSSWEGTRNVVKVRYVDRDANFTEGIAQAVDSANLEARLGEKSEEEFPFVGLSNAAAAQRVAARVLRTVAYGLKSIELVADRRASSLRPGDVFRLTLTTEGISDMVVRVTKIHTGELRDGRVRIDVVEDIFGVAWTAYSSPAPSEWVDPVQPPGPLLAPRLVELPYALVVGPDRLVMTVAGNGTPESKGYQVWSDPLGGTDYSFTRDVAGVCASGTLMVELNQGGDTLRLVPGPGMETITPASAADFNQGAALLLVDDEIMAWENIALELDGTYTVTGCRRGSVDTAPRRHAIGARVYFISDGVGITQATPFASDVTVSAKLLGYNALGIQSLDAAVAVSLATNSRALRPYVPTNVLVNGAVYPELIAGAILVSWSHRNRLGTWTYGNAGAVGTPEPSTTYTLRFYDTFNILRRTYSGLTGTSQTWTTEDSDSGLGAGVLNGRVRFTLEAEIAGLVSFQFVDAEVWRSIVSIQGPILGHMQRAAALAAARRRRRRAWGGADGT